ncbi:MAG TPA: hypothetical protein VNS09_07320 [Solirubrobacter sp.]|nr:hypothetical protein [Solirubrobacter sp.]
MADRTPEAAPDDSEVLAAARNPDTVRQALDRERRDAREARREATRLRERLAEVEAQLAEARAQLAVEPEAVEPEAEPLAADALPLAARLAARDAGLPPEAARWLQGETVAELEADAARLAAQLA